MDAIKIIIQQIENGTIDDFLKNCKEDKKNKVIELSPGMLIAWDLVNEIRRNPDYYKQFQD